MSAAEFDHVANDYDDVFTHSEIGKRQRARVHLYLEKYLLNASNQDILELNCGTGEDAVWLAKKGHCVLATDVSSAMLSRAQAKAAKASVTDLLTTAIFDFSQPDQFESTNKYDLIFSNFGGLNCLSPEQLERLLQRLSPLLKPNGKLVLVAMPKVCHWEKVYFLFKANLRKMNRRKTNDALPVHVDGKMVNTWYYDPNQFTDFANSNFVQVRKQPIAYALPPSFLEPFMVKRLWFLKWLFWMEEGFSRFSFLARCSDHYVVELERYNQNI